MHDGMQYDPILVLVLCHVTLSLVEMSLVTSQPSVPYGANLLIFCIAFDIFAVGRDRDFKFGRQVGRSKCWQCCSLCWISSHVVIKGNEMADKAAKDGICAVITQGKIPPESFFTHISKLCMKEWQDSWDRTPTNKLFSIKPVLGKNKPHTSLCRRDETVLTRLRIGYSRVTHSYLLSRESQPVCDHC